MKKIILLFVTCLLTVSASFASGNPELVKELEEKLIIDLSDVDLNETDLEYVVVTFTIVNGAISIDTISSDNEELQKILTNKLGAINIDCECTYTQMYSYKFTFEKI